MSFQEVACLASSSVVGSPKVEVAKKDKLRRERMEAEMEDFMMS